jgi:hypothetical protein
MFTDIPRVCDTSNAAIDADWVALRKELEFLKGCQVRYFVLSVTATGAVLGFAQRLSVTPTDHVLYLAPLLVTLPCWWIFFDKSTTISRIVGYVRVLEDIRRTGKTESHQYIGWENALELFRSRQPKGIGPWFSEWIKGLRGGVRSLLLLTTHKYWALNYWTFAGLCGASLWMARGLETSNNRPVWIVFVVLSLFSAIYNLSVLGRLTHGSASYRSNYAKWNDVVHDVAPTPSDLVV